MSMHRALTIGLLAVGLLALTASPAAADPAVPTHYDSVITGIDDPAGGPLPIEVEVLGGDAFLVVRADPGTAVEVPGYQGEPYVRIDADGTVHVNERSEARWVNDERYGIPGAELPPIVDNEAPPSWVQAGDGGEYAWHDHRIHYMSPSLPQQVDPDAGTPQPVWDWTVPLIVDGRQVELTGSLTWLPGPSPALPIGLTLVLAAVTVAVVWRWRAALVPLLAVAIVAGAAIGAAKLIGLPAGADGEPALLVLPAIATGAVLLGTVLGRRQAAATWLIPAAGVPVLVWGILQSGALVRPIVPGPVAVEVVRVVVAATLAIGAAAVAAAGRQLLAATRVTVDDPDRDPHPVGDA
jgi:hypothetical protein